MRHKGNSFFIQFASFVTRNGLGVIASALFIALFLSYPLAGLRIDSSIRNYLKKGDPYSVDYEKFKTLFGSDKRIVIGVQTPGIFAKPFLDRLRELHRSLENGVPYVHRVKSILSAPYFHGENDHLRVSSLLDSWPDSESAYEQAAKMVSAVPLYRNRYFTVDHRFSILILELDKNMAKKKRMTYEDALKGFDGFGESDSQTGVQKAISTRFSREENALLVRSVEKIVKQHQQKDFRLYVSGQPIYKNFFRETIVKDATRFIGFSIIIAALCLFFVFRNISVVLMSLLVVAASLSSTIGLFTFFGRSVSSITTIFPSILIAVGVSSCVHILTRFSRYYQNGKTRVEAIILSLDHCGFTVFFASITTAVGLFSFSASSIAPIANLGIFGGAGVLLSLFYILFLLPAMLAVWPGSLKKQSSVFFTGLNFEKILVQIARFSTSHSRWIIVFAFACVVFAVPGFFKLRLSHNPLKWLPEQNAVQIATRTLDQQFNGVVNVEILIDSREINRLNKLAWLRKLDNLDLLLGQISTKEVQVGMVTSPADVIKLVNWSLHGNHPSHYTLPESQSMLDQEMLLIELNSDLLMRDYVASDYRYGRITLHAPWVDAVSYGRFLEKVELKCREVLNNEADFMVTGHIPLLSRTAYMTLKSMTTSYLFAGIVITVLMILLLGDIKIGFLSIAPNLFPIIFALGLVGWLNMPLDMLTMLVGCIALGLIVDDTIHFMYNFRRYYNLLNDVDLAVLRTMETAGRALVITSIVLSAAALVLTLSSIQTIKNFGTVMGVTILLALFADIILAPALMARVYKRRSSKK